MAPAVRDERAGWRRPRSPRRRGAPDQERPRRARSSGPRARDCSRARDSTSSRAGRCQSRWPSVFFRRGARVASACGWATGVEASSRAQRVDQDHLGSDGRPDGRPVPPPSRPSPIGVRAVRSTAPVSMPSSICMMSHARLGLAADDRPRDGRRSPIPGEQRAVDVDRSARGDVEHGRGAGSARTRRPPRRRRASARSRSGHSGSRRRGGCRIGRPASSAATLTGDGVSRWPR